jgi:hypothetical protein
MVPICNFSAYFFIVAYILSMHRIPFRKAPTRMPVWARWMRTGTHWRSRFVIRPTSYVSRSPVRREYPCPRHNQSRCVTESILMSHSCRLLHTITAHTPTRTGEHTSKWYRGTVHGAYISGQRAAAEVLAAWAPPAPPTSAAASVLPTAMTAAIALFVAIGLVF